MLELAYLLCYPLVPAAFTVVWTSGAHDDVGFFWLSVLGSGYVCYFSLPWAAARPPRLVDPLADRAPHAVAALNAAVLGRLSHQRVTFPSGHVAVAFAAALSVASVSPWAATGFALMALAVGAAAVAGRYHYAVDVVLGLAVGVLVPAAARLAA